MRETNCWYKHVCDKDCDGCIRYLEMKYMIESSRLPENLQHSPKLIPDDEDFEAFCKLADIKDGIKAFVQNGSNLYITSANTGNGKTSWSIKLLLKYFDEIWAGNGCKTRGLFIHTPTLLAQLKDFNNVLPNKYDKQELLDCDLVVWDDIASTSLSNYDLTQLLIYIDYRVLNGKSNIYTGNIITSTVMSKVLGERLTSRIWNSSLVIKLNGKDKRRQV